MTTDNTDDLDMFRAHHCGGRITHVGLDYGGTMTSGNGPADPGMGMRLVSADAANAFRQLVKADVTLALVSNTRPGQDRRRALKAAGIAAPFGDRIYLSHELGITILRTKSLPKLPPPAENRACHPSMTNFIRAGVA